MVPKLNPMYEKIAKAVEKYPCLYDMKCSNYKDQALKNKSWRAIGIVCGFKGEDDKEKADSAKKTWVNLKKLLYKRLAEKKHAFRLGITPDEEKLVEIEEKLSQLDFVKWLLGFVNIRKSDEEEDDDGDEDDDDEEEDN